jgi:hypothetical protein
MIEAIYSSEEVIDFAWELSQDDLYASYARIKSMKELESEIQRALREDNYNIVACYNQNVLCGVCIYFWISDEKYVQTRAFLIRGDYDQIAEEFICHIRKQFPGYELLIGVPFSNKNANGYFKKNNIECIDASIVTKLYNLEYNINQNHNCVEKITDTNFEEYAIFHDKYAIPLEMYYNSKNLQKDMDIFRIFVFSQDEAIRGSIFVKIVRDTAEVFGLFIDKKYENNGVESILINYMLMQLYNEFGSIRELTYFIVEDCVNELNSALAAGFEIKDKYRCYKCIL